MPRILVIIDYYLPGFKAGGPLRTLHYLVDSLGDEFEFWIVTRDRDLGDREAYADVPLEKWTRVGKAQVYYIAAKRLTLGRLSRLLHETPHDVLYLNSLFSPPFTVQPLFLRTLGRLPDVPVILRPRGELNPGALALKPVKKKIHLAVTQALGFYRGVLWHASTEHEVEDIHRNFGAKAEVFTAPNLALPLDGSPPATRAKKPGELKVVFLSRVAKKKNLALALRMLDGLVGQVEMEIYGPLEEPEYWAECQRVIQSLPANVKVEYRGETRPEQVIEVLRKNHVLLFPTMGENFGHVIFEALGAGCPVIVSDRTPWRDLEVQECGWDFSLENEQGFRNALQFCLTMTDEQFRRWSASAKKRAMAYTMESGALEQNRNLFLTALKREVTGPAVSNG